MWRFGAKLANFTLSTLKLKLCLSNYQNYRTHMMLWSL